MKNKVLNNFEYKLKDLRQIQPILLNLMYSYF